MYRDDEVISYYYKPVQTYIKIQDEEYKGNSMIIFPDRVEGGTSYKKGQIELMIERKINGEDGKGIPEILNDEYNLTVNHYVLLELGDKNVESKIEKKVQIYKEKEPLVFVISADRLFSSDQNNFALTPTMQFENLGPNMKFLRVDVEMRGDRLFGLRLINYGDEVIQVDFEYLLLSHNFDVLKIYRIVEKSIEGYWDKKNGEFK